MTRWAPLLLIAVTLGCDANFYEDPVDDDRREWGTQALPAAPCIGDRDGVIAFEELMVDPDAAILAAYAVNGADTTVLLDEPGGLEEADGRFTWELSGVDAVVDEVVSVGPRALQGRWYETHFPSDAFDSLLDGPSRMMGVYRLDEDESALLLLGIAAEEPGDYLVYDPPVPMLRLPLGDGDAWAADDTLAEGTVGGEAYPQDLGIDGVVSLVHTYSMEVDGAGVIELPVGDLDVLRLRVEHRQEAHNSVAGLVAADSSRATLFVAECLGVVARLRSLGDEVDSDFDEAVEVLRLGFDEELMP